MLAEAARLPGDALDLGQDVERAAVLSLGALQQRLRELARGQTRGRGRSLGLRRAHEAGGVETKSLRGVDE